jgi:hypothetical protein
MNIEPNSESDLVANRVIGDSILQVERQLIFGIIHMPDVKFILVRDLFRFQNNNPFNQKLHTKNKESYRLRQSEMRFREK